MGKTNFKADRSILDDLEKLKKEEEEETSLTRKRKIYASQDASVDELLSTAHREAVGGGEDKTKNKKEDENKKGDADGIGDDDDSGGESGDEKDELDLATGIGEEKKVMEFNDEGTKLTGFSMDEELEEGFFNKKGAWIERKNEEEEELGKDPWLSSLDWNKEGSYHKLIQEDEDMEEIEEININETLQKIKDILNDKETVAKALSRLGGNKKAKRRNPKKRVTTAPPATSMEEKNEGDMEMFKLLTDLANKVVAGGYFEIYSDTKDSILAIIEKKEFSNIVISGGDTLKRSVEEPEEQPDAKKRQLDEDKEDEDKDNNDNETYWMYKWTVDSTELFGPYDSKTMDDWKDGGMFNDDVQVCKKGTEQFYPVKRVDFELYYDE